MGTMFDTVGDPAQTFHGLTVEAVAAYGNGHFPTTTRPRPSSPTRIS